MVVVEQFVFRFAFVFRNLYKDAEGVFWSDRYALTDGEVVLMVLTLLDEVRGDHPHVLEELIQCIMVGRLKDII